MCHSEPTRASDYDDVIKWKHFPRNRPFVWGIHRSPVNSPHKGQWHGALMFSLICDWINGWVNNREAGDLSRHRANYDVIVMSWWDVDMAGRTDRRKDKEPKRHIHAYIYTQYISESHRICTRFCSALICCVIWSTPRRSMRLIYPYPSGLFHWHWGNHRISPVPVK